MKFRKLLLFLLSAALVSGFLISRGEAAPAKIAQNGVASFVPTGQVANNVAFKIAFDDAIVSRDDIGKVFSLDDFPFTISPSIQAEGKWLDNRTFSASLLAPLDMGTVYTATVRDDLKNLKGRSVGTGVKYTFQTDPLSLLAVRASGTRNGEADIQFDFNMPVFPSRLQGFLSIANSSGTPLGHRVSGTAAAKTLHATVYIGDMSQTVQLGVRVAAGLTGETGALGLSKDEARSLEIKPVLRIDNVTAENSVVRVYSNFSIDLDAAKEFIKIEPETSFSLDSYYGGMFYIRGDFKPRERFVFTFKKGLSSEQNGLALEEDYTQAVIMPDLPPSIALPATGTFLSPIGGGRIPVELVNVNKMQVGLWRLYENNLPYVMRGDYAYFQRDLARRVYNKELQLSLPLNEKVRRSIVLDELLEGDRGLFLLTLSNPDYDYWYERSQIVNLSDMGATVRLWEDGILVWVNTLSGLEPITDADIRVYSYANQLLAEGKTDADGLWQLQRDETWSKDEDMAPYFVSISKERDVTFVRLTRGLLSQESFDTSGRPWLRSGYDAALFSARDIYRTGERAPFKAVVRQYDLSTPQPFPVLFVVRDPLGRTVKRGTELLSEEGGALFNLDLPGSALTGVWDISLYVPGDESRSLAQMSFHVEDFAPPRIEVKLNTEVKRLMPGDEVEFDISARYLFGVDGGGLRWESEWRARQGYFAPKRDKWAAYTFGDAERFFSSNSEEIYSGNLDEEGAGHASFSLPDDWQAPSIIDVTVVGRVMEEGGRWVSDSFSFPYYPTRWILGLAAPEGTLAVGNDLRFRVAAVTPDEEPADPGELTATLYRVSWNYNLVELDGYTRWQSSEEYHKIESKTVALAEGTGEAVFKPERWGTYVIRLADAEDDARASLRFYADDPRYAERDGSQLLDRVEIELDKETYQLGDVAKVTLRAPFEGLLLFNVEALGLIDRKIVKVDKAEVVIEVPVTEKMIPNAWCAAWLIRPVVESEAWSTHRAVGIKRLKVDTAASRLEVGVKVAEKVEPATKLPVEISLKDAQGKPAKGEVALALVDDGVLGLTNFKTPDLLNRFLGPRSMNSDGYDIYDLLMPLESRSTELLHPSGGAAMAAFAGAAKAQRFKILSLFEGILSADETGVVKTELELPEFSGRGRLFVVAASGARFGQAELRVQIARDIVTEADLPRFAAPGDTFTVPVTVFNSGEESRDVTVALSTLGELSVGEGEMKTTVSAKGSHKWTATLKAQKPGTATYIVETRWKDAAGEGKSFVQSVDLPVRSPFPVVTLSGSGLFESGDTGINVDKDAFAGPISGKLSLADMPLVDLTKATSFLTAYPYGCLEQTLSTAWPFLVLPDALSEIDPLLVNSDAVKRKTASALARLQAMQLYDGSFGRWPGDGHPYNWGSVYAAHFLVEARKAGIDYPEEMLKGSLNWLKQFLASIPGNTYKYQEWDDFTTKAYAVYVLALNGEKPLGWMHFLKENRNDMWPSGRVWLAGAYAVVEGRADALRELGSWGGNDSIAPDALYETLDSNVRNTAQLLSMWAEVEPKSPEAVKLVQMLLDWGKQNRWHSTQENAAVTMALGRYLTKVGYEKGQLEGILANDDGQAIVSFRSGEKTSVNVEDLPEGPWLLKTTGKGNGYYSWSITGTPSAAPKPERKGITVDYRWTDRDGNRLALDLPFEQGTEIVGTLVLTPTLPVSNLVVSYLLPAGMEIENPRLKDNEAQENWGVRYDVRDDRLLLYIDRLSEKTEYRFIMRAVTKGSFAVPPVAAEGMYDPGVRFVGEVEGNVTVK